VGQKQLRVVFGLTSEHSLAQMARAVITAYYGQRGLGFGLCGVVTGAELSRPNPRGVADGWLRTQAPTRGRRGAP